MAKYKDILGNVGEEDLTVANSTKASTKSLIDKVIKDGKGGTI